MYNNLIKSINKNQLLILKNINKNNTRCIFTTTNFNNNNKIILPIQQEQQKLNYCTTNSSSFIHKNKTTFDDIIDSQNTIEIKGVPSNITTKDVLKEFGDFQIIPHGIKMVFNGEIGFIYISFSNKKDFTRAIEMKSFSFANGSFSILPLKSNLSNWSEHKSDDSPRTSYLNRTAVTDHLWKSRKSKDERIIDNTKAAAAAAKSNIHSPLSTTSTTTAPTTPNTQFKEPPKLTTKIPIDSFTEVDLFFSSDLALREIYLSPYGHLRIGRLLEDLDALAGTVSFKHAENDEDTFKKTIVTASVDRISLLQPLMPDRDIKMQGVVTYVGKSSMEIMIKLESKNNETQQWEPVLVAFFTMVARENGRASPVNQLQVTNEYESKLFSIGEKHKTCRINHKQQSLENTPPTVDELQIIHNLFMAEKQSTDSNPLNDPLELIKMCDTTTQSVILCQPQERNINGTIFGGYLLRKGFETAFTTAFLKFNESLPRFCAMDDISFLLPVEIGDILTLESTIVYSSQIQGKPKNHYHAQVEVLAYITNPYIGKKKLSNVFNFTFYCEPSSTTQITDQTKTKQILPSTYSEAMRFIAGKRIVDRHIDSEKSPENLEIWSNKIK